MTLKKLNQKEIKNKQLTMLSYFHDICIKNKLTYSLTAGSLIGTVRHQGYIPWDDDIDVMMPRPDYNILLNLFKNNKYKFDLVSCENNIYYPYYFAKLVDHSTILKDQFCNLDKAELGVFIDIFPIDGLGNTYAAAKKNVKRRLLLKKILDYSITKNYCPNKNYCFFKRIILYLLYFISKFVDANRIANYIEKNNSMLNFNQTKFAGSYFDFRDKTILESLKYKDLIDAKFENINIKIIRCYDEYLQKCYGDYMQLPPEDKQKTHHTFTIYQK